MCFGCDNETFRPFAIEALEMLKMQSCSFTFTSSLTPLQQRLPTFPTAAACRNGLILAANPAFELLCCIQSASHAAGNVPRRSESRKTAAGSIRSSFCEGALRNCFGEKVLVEPKLASLLPLCAVGAPSRHLLQDGPWKSCSLESQYSLRG